MNWSGHGRRLHIAPPSGSWCGRGGSFSPHAFSWMVGADLGWNPVTNLNFDLELMYQSTVQAAPSGFIGTVNNLGGVGGAFFLPGGWQGVSDGFARPAPHHPVLLIASRSVETNEPRSESSGVFCLELGVATGPRRAAWRGKLPHGSPSASRAGPQSRQFPPYAGRAIKDKDGSLLAVFESTSKIPLNAKKRFREAVNKEPRRE